MLRIGIPKRIRIIKKDVPGDGELSLGRFHKQAMGCCRSFQKQLKKKYLIKQIFGIPLQKSSPEDQAVFNVGCIKSVFDKYFV